MTTFVAEPMHFEGQDSQDSSLLEIPSDAFGHRSCCDKESACPGCCDICKGKCNKKKVIVSFLITAACFAAIFVTDDQLLNGQLMYQVRLALGLTNCGWLISLAKKNHVCVEVPPKEVEEEEESRRWLRSRKLVLDELNVPTAEDRSMKFYCNDAPEYADTHEECWKYCSADHIYIKQVFLVEDEDDNRKSWSGFHLQVVYNEEVKSYDMDFALGCKGGEKEYLSQTFDSESFQCGYSEIGYDLYHNVPTSDCAINGHCEEKKVNGETYYYARMKNLVFGPDLQNAIKMVKSGEQKPGIYTHAYPRDYDHIVKGCTAEYKVDFVVPERYRSEPEV